MIYFREKTIKTTQSKKLFLKFKNFSLVQHPSFVAVTILISGGSRIFPRGVRQLPKLLLFFKILPKTAWKWKNLDPQGGRASLAPPPLRSANVDVLQQSNRNHQDCLYCNALPPMYQQTIIDSMMYKILFCFPFIQCPESRWKCRKKIMFFLQSNRDLSLIEWLKSRVQGRCENYPKLIGCWNSRVQGKCEYTSTSDWVAKPISAIKT